MEIATKRTFVIMSTVMLICSTFSVFSMAIVPASATTSSDYVVFSQFDPGVGYIWACGGYVEYYGVPEWGDEIQYIYFISGTTGYKYKVWVTNEGSPSDPTPYIDIRQHPNSPYPDHVGPIEPRHFEYVSSANLAPYSANLDVEEFYVDSTGVYLGPNVGIHKWDHDWNYLGQIGPAFGGGFTCQSLAYNAKDNIWYTGTYDRKIYQLSDTDGDGDLMDETWQYIFTYPSYGGGHHDGMEYVGGYLWISDMTVSVIGKWQYDESTNTWIEVGRYTYPYVHYIEGMGFGPNDHFWMTSGFPGGGGTIFYEVGDEITMYYPIADAGEDVPAHPPTIPVKFDGSGSHHTDPSRKIVLYEWDFDGDCVYDYSSSNPFAEHAYPAYYNPDGSIDWDATAKVYTVYLRVTDDDPVTPKTDVDTCVVHITAPPWKPVSDPDGPYEGHVGLPVQLDGSKSYDPESKMFPEDHPWYETIATYEWDLDYDGEFDDATGPNPTYTWDNEGLYIIGLKVTDSQPSGLGGTVGPLDVDKKYTTVVVKKPAFNIAVIFTKFADDDPAPSRSLRDFENIKNDMLSYYSEVSYGSVSFDIKFYPDDGTWLELPHNRKYYGKNDEQFVKDAISVSDPIIDFTAYDYNSENGRGVVMLIHAGYSRQQSLSPDDMSTQVKYGNVFSALGGYDTDDNTKVDAIIVAEMENVGSWAHEVGHVLGKLLVTSVTGASKDGAWYLPDRYKGGYFAGNGEIGDWGLMGTGCWLPRDWLGRGTGAHPDHMCSYSKVWLGWLKYREYQHPSYGTYWINSLVTMKYGDDVFKYKINDNMYYILEVRNKNSKYSNWDTTAPIERPTPVWTYDSAEVIYKVEKKNDMWIVNVASHIVLFPFQDYHSDDANEVMFKVVDEKWGTKYEMKTEIKKPSIWEKIGVILNPGGQLLSLISKVIHGMPFQFEYPLPDLDLHAYSDDGKHVGMNYTTGEYEIQIPNATASGDLWNGQEWIFVPEDVNVHFVVDAKDNKEFFDAFPKAWEISDGIENFDLSLVYYDSDGNRWESAPITEQINPGETIWHIPVITENLDGTYTVEISPITWEHIFEDPRRRTVLKISTDDKYFQFIAPDKEFLVKHDPNMNVLKRAIIIHYKDWEIKVFAIAINTKLDFCVAIAWDGQTRTRYFLIDKVGIEE